MNAKHAVRFVIWLIVVLIIIWGGIFAWRNLRGDGSITDNSSNDAGDPSSSPIKTVGPANQTSFPLSLPSGFEISVFAKNLPGARVIQFDSIGNAWVSQTSEGKISLLEIDDGQVKNTSAPFLGLQKPHGLAFDPNDEFELYIAQENEIARSRVYAESGSEKIASLPAGDGHYTRTIAFGPDGKLYVSVGSSCNVCNEKNEQRAKILVLESGGVLREFAKGLRNSVFFTWHPVTRQMWATENGRDLLGDNLPPDEINIVVEEGNYGWPICYGKNIHDTNFDKNTYIRSPCQEPFERSSHVDLQAHSAPLGLAFVPSNSKWPSDWQYDLIVAFHGSWNRTQPTGYKLVRIKLDREGNPEGVEDFITGWLQPSGPLGRPVDVKFGPDGNLFITDDKAGLVYKIQYKN